MSTFTVIDRDGTTLAFVSDPTLACVEGFIPASGNRLLHPQSDLAREQARITQERKDFWADVATMPAPVGISSDGSF